MSKEFRRFVGIIIYHVIARYNIMLTLLSIYMHCATFEISLCAALNPLNATSPAKMLKPSTDTPVEKEEYMLNIS
ncbi:hypothetical protein BDV10DRAFT_63679 [Aspergillus recurvatus]